MTSAAKPQNWIVCPFPRPQALLRLFCFPFAGGGATIYRPWSAALPATIEVCAVQLPGRENRMSEQPFREMSALVEALVPVIWSHLSKPFAFFGHSMGSAIAYELARALRQRGGSQPVFVCASGRNAPHLPGETPPIYHLPEQEFVQELRKFNGTPEAVLEHPELMQLMLPLLRADFTLIETYSYTPGEPLDCPISAFGGLHDPLVSRAHLDEWRAHTKGTFHLRMFDGDHFFLRSMQQTVLQALTRDLLPVMNNLR